MLTIQNQTEEVLVVYNTLFSENIPIGGTVEIKSEQLQGDDKLFCRYFPACGEEVTVDYGIKREKIRRRLYMYYERTSTFPLVTVFLIKDMETLCLKEEFIQLRHILIFKTVRLRRIIAEPKNQEEKEQCLFLNIHSKKRFLKLMRISLFFLPVAIILLLVCIDCLFRNEFDWMEKIMLIVFLLSISFSIFQDVYYYFNGRKWKCSDNTRTETTGDGSVC